MGAGFTAVGVSPSKPSIGSGTSTTTLGRVDDPVYLERRMAVRGDKKLLRDATGAGELSTGAGDAARGVGIVSSGAMSRGSGAVRIVLIETFSARMGINKWMAVRTVESIPYYV